MDPRTAEKPELRLVRRYPVAAEKVWRAWTQPEALSAWFGPGDPHTVTLAELDVRAGGRYRIRFHTPDGETHEVSGEYQEVVPHEKLVFSWAWQSTPDRVSLVTVKLRPYAGGTELDFLHQRFFDAQAYAGHLHGWTLTFAKLDDWVAQGEARP